MWGRSSACGGLSGRSDGKRKAPMRRAEIPPQAKGYLLGWSTAARIDELPGEDVD